MKNKRLKMQGCGTALVTPFDNWKIDMPTYKALVTRQIEAGVDFVVALGSTAETPCLDLDERVELAKVTRELVGDKPMVVGAGANCLHETVAMINALDCSEPDAYLVVTPYYNKPTQQGLFEYFKGIASSTDRDIILYNVPSRTGVNMTADTTLRLSQIPNIIGVKEASGDIDQIMEISECAPEDFTVLSGNDNQTLALMLSGAKGVISVVSNVVPGLMTKLTHAVLEGDYATAQAINRRLAPLYKACFVESNPIPVKAAMSLMKLCSSEMRLPLTTATPSTMQLMKLVLPPVLD